MTRPNSCSFRRGTSLLFLAIVLAFSFALVPQTVVAQAEKYFPESTKGFISITNLKDFMDRLDKTSIGDLRRTPEAKDFFDSFVQELKKRIQKKSKVSLGLSLDELKDMVDGEVALGLVRPKEDVLAIITLAEFKKAAVVDAALKKIEKNLLKVKDPEGKVELVQRITEAGHTVSHFEFPDPFGIAGPPQVFYGRTDKYIIAYSGPVLAKTDKAEHVAQVRKLLKALAGKKQASLADRDLYKTTMKNLMDGDKYKNHQTKWFFESFGFIDAAKKLWPDTFNDIQFGAFRKVGFDAIKSGGGIGLITPGDREFHVRAFLYAPPVDEKNRFRLAARMLDFTADENRLLDLPVWVDQTASSYFAMHGRMLKAFTSAEPLIDELYGEGTMKQVLSNFLKNPKLKANFDLKNELAANLGDRVVVIRDPSFPAKQENKRVVLLVDVAKESNPTAGIIGKEEPKNAEKKKGPAKAKKKEDGAQKKLSRREQVYKVIKGYMANEDPNLVERIPHKVNGETITIFKKTTPKEPAGGGPPGELDLDDLDLDDLDEEEPKPAVKPGAGAAGGAPIISYYCVAQYKDQVFISPDLKFMKEILDRCGKNTKSSLASLTWFRRVNAELDKIKRPTFESLRYVARLDLPYKVAFELIKESKADLPLEKWIKKMLDEDEETRLFDLKKLPKDFEKSISPHLGNVGWSMTTEDNGWLFNGIILRKKSGDGQKPGDGKKPGDSKKPVEAKAAKKKEDPKK